MKKVTKIMIAEHQKNILNTKCCLLLQLRVMTFTNNSSELLLWGWAQLFLATVQNGV